MLLPKFKAIVKYFKSVDRAIYIALIRYIAYVFIVALLIWLLGGVVEIFICTDNFDIGDDFQCNILGYDIDWWIEPVQSLIGIIIVVICIIVGYIILVFKRISLSSKKMKSISVKENRNYDLVEKEEQDEDEDTIVINLNEEEEDIILTRNINKTGKKD